MVFIFRAYREEAGQGRQRGKRERACGERRKPFRGDGPGPSPGRSTAGLAPDTLQQWPEQLRGSPAPRPARPYGISCSTLSPRAAATLARVARRGFAVEGLSVTYRASADWLPERATPARWGRG